MHLLVGLGNPGAGHARNRHNIGFMAMDVVHDVHRFSPWQRKFNGLLAEGRIGTDKVLLLKPQTFMNRSGDSVGEAMRFYKLPVDRLTVWHDELDLAPGKLRIKRGGGAAGHNGLKSIDSHLGPEYRRVRLGIGHPGEKSRVHGHVLGDFAKADEAWLSDLLGRIAAEIPRLLAGDEGGFMSRVVSPPARPAGRTAPGIPASIEAPSPAPPTAPPTAPSRRRPGPFAALADLLKRDR